MTAVDDTPATATPDCAAEQALTTLSELSVIESSSSSSTGDFDAAPLPPPPPPITTTNSHPSRGSSSSSSRNPDLGIEIPPRDVDETSGLSEECSPGSNAASPLPVVVGGRRRSEETGSSTKLPAVATREGSGRGERKDRRASTSAVEFAREHIQSFEHNLGRGHFFSSLATSLSVHSTSSGTKPSAAASPSGGTILRQGWLMKRGGVVPAWRKRWFTLEHSADGPTLTYGKDHHKASPTKSGKASSLKTIKLSASTQCAVVPTKKDREFEFKLSTSVDVAQREYFIQAMSGVEMNAWMAAIKGAIYDCQTLAFDGSLCLLVFFLSIYPKQIGLLPADSPNLSSIDWFVVVWSFYPNIVWLTFDSLPNLSINVFDFCMYVQNPTNSRLNFGQRVDDLIGYLIRDLGFDWSIIDSCAKMIFLFEYTQVSINIVLSILTIVAMMVATVELSEMRSFWDKAGIHGFLVHYGVRKSSGRNHVQTRVLELNFAESVVINTKRGESLTTLTFSQLRQVNLLPPELEKGWGYGVELLWDAHRSWPCYLETESARDDLCGLLQHILDLRTAGGAPGGGVSPDELGKRFAQLTLKTGTLDRKNGSHNATIKGRFHVKLHEAFLAFFPEAGWLCF
ncbi:hypothetical protein AaE_008948 [Aphanomyces astaci]|uniref:PH domain-containing protein n=1 Tax=Aphanomyces astaci TaxID=112090 RepID=A0A6A5A9Q4_APHAT|nr:hypothetical protein AaE_008948 [Aphanomyces astaci]